MIVRTTTVVASLLTLSKNSCRPHALWLQGIDEDQRPHPAMGDRMSAGQVQSLRMPSTKKVLIVDDHGDTRVVLSQAVTKLGYYAIAASSGNEGLAIIEAEPVDLVVTDILMDGLDGFELWGLARVLRPQVKFVVMTGHVPSITRAYRSGLPVLLKPFSFRDVRGAIDAALPDSESPDARRAVDEFLKMIDKARDMMNSDATNEALNEALQQASKLLDIIVEELVHAGSREHQDILAAIPVLQAKLTALT